jgi:aldose 1-epimerase
MASANPMVDASVSPPSASKVSPPAAAAATFLPTGALLHTFTVGGRNIVLNFASERSYISTGNPSHFGTTTGRVANRIRGGRIVSLAGREWELARNDGENTLHGGPGGWGKRRWEEIGDGAFRLRSQHLEEGFPGEVEVVVRYEVKEKEGKTEVAIEYEATLVGGAEETVVNITNHR